LEKKYNAKESLLPVLKLRYNAQLFKSMLLTDVMIKIPLLMKLFSTKRALPGCFSTMQSLMVVHMTELFKSMVAKFAFVWPFV
jgi:hypothetical protein